MSITKLHKKKIISHYKFKFRILSFLINTGYTKDGRADYPVSVILIFSE